MNYDDPDRHIGGGYGGLPPDDGLSTCGCWLLSVVGLVVVVGLIALGMFIAGWPYR